MKRNVIHIRMVICKATEKHCAENFLTQWMWTHSIIYVLRGNLLVWICNYFSVVSTVLLLPMYKVYKWSSYTILISYLNSVFLSKCKNVNCNQKKKFFQNIFITSQWDEICSLQKYWIWLIYQLNKKSMISSIQDWSNMHEMVGMVYSVSHNFIAP